MNFFGLRLDKAADPTLQILAQEAWKIWNESKPKLLQPGEWHLPYIEDEDWENCPDEIGSKIEDVLDCLKKVSSARNARLSYLSFSTQKRSTISEDLELYNKLVGGEILHASPLEHIATPDIYEFDSNLGYIWKAPYLWGNFEQFCQYRKFLPNESVAPLPKEFQ